ncbi:hypothetical protein KY331_05455 [Candidatus Woesearchaeota archaeon]|nr:hypothetical protein [Candidatus Woesearchaeota archaeon]
MPKLRTWDIVEDPVIVGDNGICLVLRLSASHAAKLHLENPPSRMSLRSLEEECSIAKGLYDSGVSVPKPLGVFQVSVDLGSVSYRNHPAFVMEYVPGRTLNGLSPETQETAKALRDAEIAKAREAGFVPGDYSWEGNTIWSPQRQRAYLIDFETWKKAI